METPPPYLSEWDIREYTELLARETGEGREKRRIATDPDTTANELKRLAEEIRVVDIHLLRGKEAGREYKQERYWSLLVESLAQHPNMPPDTLSELVAHTIYTSSGCRPMHISPYPVYTSGARGMCRNPISPFLELEKPGFWLNLDADTVFALLREDALPPPIAISLTLHTKKWFTGNVAGDEAKLHISVAGELKTQSEWQAALTRFWQGFCSYTTDKSEQRQHDEMAQLGMVPAWAMGARANRLKKSARWYKRLNPFPPSRLNPFSIFDYTNSAFVKFVFSLEKTSQVHLDLRYMGLSLDWTRRLVAALRLPLSDAPFPTDPWNRSPRLLLQHLARDGNRFVRWAAQTRLADPDFVFTWQE